MLCVIRVVSRVLVPIGRSEPVAISVIKAA